MTTASHTPELDIGQFFQTPDELRDEIHAVAELVDALRRSAAPVLDRAAEALGADARHDDEVSTRLADLGLDRQAQEAIQSARFLTSPAKDLIDSLQTIEDMIGDVIELQMPAPNLSSVDGEA